MLEIIYRDKFYVAINKPTGLLVHRSAIDSSAKTFALQQLRDQVEQRVYPVHRLDKPTSGVLLFGFSSESAKAASQLFEGHLIKKTYIALVRGYADPSGIIEHALSWIPETKKEKKAGTKKETKPALTHYVRINKTELPFPVGRYPTCRYSLMELTPKTGRKHQLRRHMKHISHPIVGDRRYGDWRHNRFIETQFNCHRMLLHARQLTFKHPFTHERIQIYAGLDEAFADVLKAMSIKDLT